MVLDFCHKLGLASSPKNSVLILENHTTPLVSNCKQDILWQFFSIAFLIQSFIKEPKFVGCNVFWTVLYGFADAIQCTGFYSGVSEQRRLSSNGPHIFCKINNNKAKCHFPSTSSVRNLLLWCDKMWSMKTLVRYSVPLDLKENSWCQSKFMLSQKQQKNSPLMDF